MTADASTAPTPTIEGDADDPHIADLDDVYLDGTLVLVGCGKAKRDPDDPVDLHQATVGPDDPMPGTLDETGPAWAARDLYTSTYFAAKRAFAEAVTQWARAGSGSDHLGGWGILSAEHYLLHPWQPVKYYDTSIDDVGGDPTNPDHRVSNPNGKRRPDGREIVTERDQWAAMVAYTLARWIASHRDRPSIDVTNDARTLLVLAGRRYVDPLRERGVFEYGIQRMAGNPNEIYNPLDGVTVRYLFEEIDAGGNGEQMAWLSDAVDQLDDVRDPADQVELGAWTGDVRTCATCGVTAGDADVDDYGGAVYCDDHAPIGRCGRCDAWTHETGHGSNPLCPDCQTDRGGRVREPLEEPDEGEQVGLDGWSG